MTLVANANAVVFHGTGSLITGGTFVVISQPSVKVKIDGAGVYKTPLQYTFAGGSSAGFDAGTIATTAPQSIPSTAVKTKADGSLVMLEGDFGVMAAQGTILGVATPISGPVEITTAGQTKVNAQ